MSKSTSAATYTQTTLDQTDIDSALVVPCVASPALLSSDDSFSTVGCVAPALLDKTTPSPNILNNNNNDNNPNPSLLWAPFPPRTKTKIPLPLDENTGDPRSFTLPSGYPDNNALFDFILSSLSTRSSQSSSTEQALGMEYSFPSASAALNSIPQFRPDWEAEETETTRTKSISSTEHSSTADADEEILKRQRHLERNRAAAKKCRSKKKEQTERLQSRYEEESARKKALEETVRVLRSELVILKNHVLDHSECDDPAIRLYIQRMVQDVKNPDPMMNAWASVESPQLAKSDVDGYAGLSGVDEVDKVKMEDDVLGPEPEVNVFLTVPENGMP